MSIEINSDIGELIRKAEQDFTTGNVQISKYVNQDFYEDINTIEAYLNSKHISGDKDALDRDKPFFNIVLAARNIWFRATDIDRRNIRAKATKSKDYISSFLFNIHLQKWLKDSNFGRFLNDWGMYLASFNSAIVKFVEKDGQLHAMVMDWNKMIVDTIDFDSNPRIEILELTPAQLRQRPAYDQEIVEQLIENTSSRESLDQKKKDNKDNYIKLYEIHGELPLSYLTGKEEDSKEYVQQMQVVTFIEGKNKGDYDDYVLVKGREKKDPYMLTWLLPSVDGSISLMGSVKSLFDAQWMVNHSIKAIKDQLDLASKLIFQTSDGNFVGQNALSAIESGDILIHKENQPLTHLANNANDITSLQNFGQQWRLLSQEITSTPDIMMGNNMPSGTAFRQAAIIQQESHSNFEIMTENKGLHIEEMFKRYITPFLLKKMDTTDEIATTLGDYGVDKISKIYISNKAVEKFNRKAVEAVLNDTELPNLSQEEMAVREEMSQTGGEIFLKPSEIEDATWKDIIGDFEGNIVYEITNENTDKQATLDTLSSVLQTIVANPAILQDPRAKLVFNKILEETGRVSALELQEIETAPVVDRMSAVPNNNQPVQIQ